MRRLAALGALPALLALQGCYFLSGPDCVDEHRALSARATLASIASDPSPADTGYAFFGFNESRNHRTKRTTERRVFWHVRSGLVRSTVTAVHVHETGTGRLVFDVPIDSTHGPPAVITQVFEGQPYPGPLDWGEIYHMLGEGRAYVDVHTTTSPVGHLRGAIAPEYENWRNFQHSYCS